MAVFQVYKPTSRTDNLSNMMEHFDVIVIGAGIIGSSTAYHLAKDAKKTLLLEQFPNFHPRGSSHGHSRLLRKIYPYKHRHYCKMVDEAISLWKTLESEVKYTIFRPVGSLSVFTDAEIGERFEQVTSKIGMSCRKLNHADLAKEYPMLSLPETAMALYEDDCGILLADKAVRAFQDVFTMNGGTVRDMEEVLSITPGDHVTVESARGRYTADAIVITAGPWTNKVLTPLRLKLPLSPWRISVLYWKIKETGIVNIDRFPALRFPAAISNQGKHNIYIVPEMEYPGLIKICVHHGPTIDADDRDTDSYTLDIKLVSEFIKKFMPFIDHTKPAIVDKCFYTMTEDENYILDRHPSWNNIIIGAGFSGHGFKTSPRTGKILATMAQNRETGYDMSPYSIKNLLKTNPKASL